MVLPRTAAGVLLALGLVATFRAQNAAEPLPPELTALAEGFTSERPVPPTLDDAMRTWIEPAEPLKIVGPIYYVGTKGLAAYLITTPKGHILLDGGMPGSAKDFEAAIRKAGFKPEDIKLLLITHAHIDHAGLVAHFQKLSNAQVVVMDREFELLNSGGKTDFRYGDVPAFHFPPVTATRQIKDGDSISLGNVRMTARLGAGHTKGATTWITKVEGRRPLLRRGLSLLHEHQSGLPAHRRSVLSRNRRRLHAHAGDARVAEARHLAAVARRVLRPRDEEGQRGQGRRRGVRGPRGLRFLAREAEGELRAAPRQGEAARRCPERVRAGRHVLEARPFPGGRRNDADSGRRVEVHDRVQTRRTARQPVSTATGAPARGSRTRRISSSSASWTCHKKSARRGRFSTIGLRRDWTYVRSYVLKDGHLFMSLMADGGIYEFAPMAGAPARPTPPVTP